MRSERVLAALAALAALGVAGCTFVDVGRPIGLVADGLDDGDAANLAEAAACWNLQFGTQLTAGPEARSMRQQVDVFYDRATCLYDLAQTQDGWPQSIAICPERYWPGLTPASPYGPRDPRSELHATPFRVLSHELGHVLNIVGHPSDPFAVMVGGGLDREFMFRDADRAMFADANPDFTPHSDCREVIRWVRPGSGGAIGHCACNTGEHPDLARPVALAVGAGFEDDRAAAMATAAACWNLRHGLALAVRPAMPGEQALAFEPDTACPQGFAGLFVADRAGGVYCASSRPSIRPAAADQLLLDIAHALGVAWFDASRGFNAAEADAFARVYPGQPVVCRDVARDPATGACRCDDPPP